MNPVQFRTIVAVLLVIAGHTSSGDWGPPIFYIAAAISGLSAIVIYVEDKI